MGLDYSNIGLLVILPPLVFLGVFAIVIEFRLYTRLKKIV